MSEGKVHNFSARIPDDVYEGLRALAYDRCTPMNKQLVRLLRGALADEADNEVLAKHVRVILRRVRKPDS